MSKFVKFLLPVALALASFSADAAYYGDPYSGYNSNNNQGYNYQGYGQGYGNNYNQDYSGQSYNFQNPYYSGSQGGMNYIGSPQAGFSGTPAAGQTGPRTNPGSGFTISPIPVQGAPGGSGPGVGTPTGQGGTPQTGVPITPPGGSGAGGGGSVEVRTHGGRR